MSQEPIISETDLREIRKIIIQNESEQSDCIYDYKDWYSADGSYFQTIRATEDGIEHVYEVGKDSYHDLGSLDQAYAEDIESDTYKIPANSKVEEYRSVHYKTFSKNLEELRKILSSNNLDDNSMLLKMTYVHTITLMEAYLSDTLIDNSEKDAFLQKSVEGNTDLKNQTFPMNEIYKRFANVKQALKGVLLGVIYHDLGKVIKLYQAHLGVLLFEDKDGKDPNRMLFGAVKMRHNFVHRNGKDKNGNTTTVTLDNVKHLMTVVDALCIRVETQLADIHNKLPSNQPV